MSIRTVLVAHHETLVAEGLASALASFPELVPVRPADTPARALAHVGAVHVAAIDATLPEADVVATRLRDGGSRVVMIGGDDRGDEDVVRVPTNATVAVLAEALVPGVVPTSPPVLTAKQRRILNLVARGLTAQQIARHLGLSIKTVEQHKSRIFRKLGVPNQAAAVRASLSMGLTGEMA